MLGVACASPKTALLSPSSRSPLPTPLSLLGHCNLLSQKRGMVVSNMLEWDSTVQGWSKTSMSHGRGPHGEAQDTRQWLDLVSSAPWFVRPEILTQELLQQSACYSNSFCLSNLSAGERANCWVSLQSPGRSELFLGCTVKEEGDEEKEE